MAKAAADEFGGIDILVNNAEVFASLRGGPMNDISVERWDSTMAANFRGPWLCICAVAPCMRERGGGAILNQTSISAFGDGSKFMTGETLVVDGGRYFLG